MKYGEFIMNKESNINNGIWFYINNKWVHLLRVDEYEESFYYVDGVRQKFLDNELEDINNE